VETVLASPEIVILRLDRRIGFKSLAIDPKPLICPRSAIPRAASTSAAPAGNDPPVKPGG